MNEINQTEVQEDQNEEIAVDQGPASEPTENQVTASGHERLILFLVAAIIVLIDQGTKYLVRATIPTYTYWAPIPSIENFFRFTHTTNTGVAFGLFPNGNTIFAIFAVVVSIAIIYYNQTLELGNRPLRVALGLQMGGALGNLISRIYPGHVVDFLDFGPWPIFNVADMAIVAGTILLAWLMLQEERSQQAEGDSQHSSDSSSDEDQAFIAEPIADQANESPKN